MDCDIIIPLFACSFSPFPRKARVSSFVSAFVYHLWVVARFPFPPPFPSLAVTVEGLCVHTQRDRKESSQKKSVCIFSAHADLANCLRKKCFSTLAPCTSNNLLLQKRNIVLAVQFFSQNILPLCEVWLDTVATGN